jgi:hypothetical protein
MLRKLSTWSYLKIRLQNTGLEVNAEKTKYMVISQNQNAGHNHNIKINNKSFERVEEFKYLGATLTIETPFVKKLRAG